MHSRIVSSAAAAVRQRGPYRLGHQPQTTEWIFRRTVFVSPPTPRYLSTVKTSTKKNKNNHHDNDDTTTTTTTSARKRFQALPVHSSILRYIESIGVGIPKKTKQKLKSRNDNKKSEKDERLMDDRQEQDFFNRQRRNATGKSRNIILPDTLKQEQPPLPFGIPHYLNNNNNNGESSSSSLSRKIKRKKVEIVWTVVDSNDKFPTNKLIPEVALAGRSNVGKSSLLNALLYGDPSFHTDRGGRSRHPAPKSPRGIKAIESPRPGETKQISFYEIAPPKELRHDNNNHNKNGGGLVQKLWLIDLPGYGFAFDGKSDEWQSCTRQYILQRSKQTLRRILLLLDARHGMKTADVEFLTSLEQERRQLQLLTADNTTTTNNNKKRAGQLPPIQLVLTKCDLVSQADLARRVVQVEQQLSDCLMRQTSNLPTLLVSVKREHRGVLEIQKELASLVPSEARKYDKETKKY